MSEYVKCPLCGIETRADEAHGCAGPRAEIVDPRDETIQRLRHLLAESESKCAKMREILGECRPVADKLSKLADAALLIVDSERVDKRQADWASLSARIDAILESEE